MGQELGMPGSRFFLPGGRPPRFCFFEFAVVFLSRAFGPCTFVSASGGGTWPFS